MPPRRTSRKAAARHAVTALLLVTAAMAAMMLGACSQTRPEPKPVSVAPTPEPTSAPEPSATPTPAAGSPVPLASLAIALEPVAKGFDSPVLVTNAGDGSGRLFVVEQSGRVWALRDGKQATKPFVDVSNRISTGGERGLLGLAFAPDYASSGIFYLNYTNTGGDTNVVRLKAADPASDSPAITSRKVVLKVKQPYANHNGGCLVFEPGSKRLWVGMGDGGSGGDPRGNAQNPKALLGKMLVLDFDKGISPRPEIVQSGVRNPWRFSFDRKTDELWIGDVGQNAWEEIDWVPLAEATGVDWGWNLWEGTHPYPEGATPSKKGHRFPVVEYSHDSGRSVTGGFVYRGKDYPGLDGTYFYGDFEAGWIAAIRAPAGLDYRRAGAESRVLLNDTGIMPSSFGESEDGELYVCDYGGTIQRIVAK